MSSSLRQDLIRNAVAFLGDPKIQSSPVAKRIEFLEAKGLTSAEVEEAIRQAAPSSSTSAAVSAASPYPVTPFVSQQYAYAARPAPPVPQLDWRDYFIMAVVSGGVMYGLASLARKYLWPHMQPPASTAYEADRDALAAQFDAVAALVADMQAESNSTRTAVEKQRADVERVTEEVEEAVRDLRLAESKAENELREIRMEVDAIKDLLPKMMDKTRDAQTQSLSELRTELASLKSLLLTLGPSASGATTPAPMPIPRPTIPAWQLASTPRPTSTAAGSTAAGASSSASTTNGVSSSTSAPSVFKGPATPEPEDSP